MFARSNFIVVALQKDAGQYETQNKQTKTRTQGYIIGALRCLFTIGKHVPHALICYIRHFCSLTEKAVLLKQSHGPTHFLVIIRVQ